MLARHFGGIEAVRAMTFAEYAAARQLLIEERVGRRVRAEAASEDAAFANARALLS